MSFGLQDQNRIVKVVATKTRDAGVPVDYDPSRFPAFAVTVDVVILTMSEGELHGLPPT